MRWLPYEKVQSTREKETSVKKQPIIYGCSQKEIMLRVKIVISGVLFNQVKIDGMTAIRRKQGTKLIH